MTAIITAALLERYLVATGWERGESPALDWVRLGLCAAAEDRLIAAEEYRKAAAGMTQAGHLVESKLAITLAEAADDAATRFLEMAGVSRERWDAARKGGS